MPAASRSQSSHAQPCAWTHAARNNDASATRPVMTMSAPLASASAIGRAPRYAAANSGGAGRGGRVDAARVGDDLGPAVGDVRERAGEVCGQVARVPAGLVALTVLLEDRKGQLGEGLEAQVVDSLGEEGVDRGRGVAVEALPAGDLHLRPLTSDRSRSERLRVNGGTPIDPGRGRLDLSGDADQEVFARERADEMGPDR